MLNSQLIINQIREDAQAVYDILTELYHYQYSTIDGGTSPKEDPTADQLLEILTEYDGVHHDLHYWSGRYAQMIEQDNNRNTPIRVQLTESDLYDLLS